MHINAAAASAGPGSADGTVAVAANGAADGVVGQDGRQDAQSVSLAVHHSVIDSNGVAVDVGSSRDSGSDRGRDSGIGGCHLLIVVATDGN